MDGKMDWKEVILILTTLIISTIVFHFYNDLIFTFEVIVIILSIGYSLIGYKKKENQQSTRSN
jgi:uncharacterized membrane protein